MLLKRHRDVVALPDVRPDPGDTGRGAVSAPRRSNQGLITISPKFLSRVFDVHDKRVLRANVPSILANSKYDIDGKVYTVSPTTGLLVIQTVLKSSTGPLHIYGMNWNFGGKGSVTTHSGDVERAFISKMERLVIHPTASSKHYS